MQKQHSRIGIIASLSLHSAVFVGIWALLQLPQVKPVEEVSSISLELIAARLEQPQVATAPEVQPEAEELPEEQDEPESKVPEPEIKEPEPLPEPVVQQKKEEPKPKEKPKEQPKLKEKPKEKPKDKPLEKKEPKVVKAVEKAPEVKQGIVAKAIPEAIQGKKAQVGIPEGAEKGSNAKSSGNTIGNGSSASSDEINAYKATIQRILQRKANNAYPQREKMMRKRGTVYLKFALSSSGVVSNVSVTKSSGNDNLDRAAVKATESASMPPPPKGFPSSVDVPVSFTLE